jgi:hypothetical protein
VVIGVSPKQLVFLSFSSVSAPGRAGPTFHLTKEYDFHKGLATFGSLGSVTGIPRLWNI